MLFKQRLQKNLLITAGIILASLLLGKYLVRPFAVYFRDNMAALLLGAGALSLGQILVNFCRSILINLRRVQIHREDFPEDANAVRAIGVETPMDFAFMMNRLTSCHVCPMFNNRLPKAMQSGDPKLLKKGEALFEELFGRKPLGAESWDWRQIARLEAAQKLGKDPKDVNSMDCLKQTSERVRKYFRNSPHNRSRHLKDDPKA